MAETAKLQKQQSEPSYLAKEPVIKHLEDRLAGLGSQESMWQKR